MLNQASLNRSLNPIEIKLNKDSVKQDSFKQPFKKRLNDTNIISKNTQMTNTGLWESLNSRICKSQIQPNKDSYKQDLFQE